MEEKEDKLALDSNVLKEPRVVLSKTEIKDQPFIKPLIDLIKLKNIKKKCLKFGKSRQNLEAANEETQTHKRKKFKRRSKKKVQVELASDKNIATLLRSERLIDTIKSGCNIPYSSGYYISQKTGFKSVSDLNDYISAHRNKFIVLIEKKEKNCQTESDKCNQPFQRSDSVDLDLFFKHHYGSGFDENQSS